MASPSGEIDSDATISDISSPDVPVVEIPPPVLDEEEVAMEEWDKEVEIPQWLKVLPGTQEQDWRAFVHKRLNGRTDRTYIHKKYRNHFRSKCEVEEFVRTQGITIGKFRGRKLQKKKIAGMGAQDAGTSKSTGRIASANHARRKRSLGKSRSIDDEEMPRGFL